MVPACILNFLEDNELGEPPPVDRAGVTAGLLGRLLAATPQSEDG